MLGMYVFAKSNIWRCELSACLSVKFFFKKKGQNTSTQRTNRCGAENPQNPTQGDIVFWQRTLLKHLPNYQGYCQSWQQQTGIG